MMFVVYNTSTGSIIKSVSCPANMADAQCGPGEAWIEHDLVDDSKFRVDLDTLEIVPTENEAEAFSE